MVRVPSPEDIETNRRTRPSESALPAHRDRGEIFWGKAQHQRPAAFYQLIRQGTRLVPADFIAFSEPNHDIGDMHDLFMPNFFAQTALVQESHRDRLPGRRPGVGAVVAGSRSGRADISSTQGGTRRP
ncbi:hypothetical protein [Micromonospora sp. NPDC023644]|uniref:hypothetical protein n=1 Tax=Micromonospora sp. NPDC023644 TaxID=3154321 RepID=UPI0033F4D02A